MTTFHQNRLSHGYCERSIVKLTGPVHTIAPP